jgi:hypothetical protein
MTDFQRAVYSALGDEEGLNILKENQDMAKQYKPLLLDIANANLNESPSPAEKAVIEELIAYLETLPDPTGGRRRKTRRRKTKRRNKK